MNQANRRPPARTGGVSPVVQVGLVVVALILGFIILRSAFDDDDGSAADTPDVTEPETGTTDVAPTTTAAATDLTTAQVLVVNGAGVQGLAGRVTEALQGAGVPTLEPTTANSKFQGSGVYGSTGFEQQARAVGNMLGIDSVQSFPAQFPLEDPNALGNANVVVIIGTDLAEFAGVTATTTAGAAGTTTTAAGAATTSTG